MSLRNVKNLFFAISLCLTASSAYALAKMGPQSAPSLFHYTPMYLFCLEVVGLFFLFTLKANLYSFLISERTVTFLLVANPILIAVIAVFTSMAQGDIADALSRNTDYYESLYGPVHNRSAFIIFTVIFILFQMMESIICIKIGERHLSWKGITAHLTINAMFSLFITYAIAIISIPIYSGWPYIRFPIRF